MKRKGQVEIGLYSYVWERLSCLASALRINPMLLDSIGYLNDKEKDDVRKIMSSKQLFSEEMCSYCEINMFLIYQECTLESFIYTTFVKVGTYEQMGKVTNAISYIWLKCLFSRWGRG
ncbi:hypothetical protein HID58_075720 [Brassica napus]|uniref:Uncharacterized protein n=1 Tax=Brassica napus TaxID=3708 RepID=A0ABQ7YKG2_BRANA|nr:hypothetical protein HID58_075720 [Brassica napus]